MSLTGWCAIRGPAWEAGTVASLLLGLPCRFPLGLPPPYYPLPVAPSTPHLPPGSMLTPKQARPQPSPPPGPSPEPGPCTPARRFPPQQGVRWPLGTPCPPSPGGRLGPGSWKLQRKKTASLQGHLPRGQGLRVPGGGCPGPEGDQANPQLAQSWDTPTPTPTSELEAKRTRKPVGVEGGATLRSGGRLGIPSRTSPSPGLWPDT